MSAPLEAALGHFAAYARVASENRATAIRPEAIQSDYRDFKLSFEYGYYTAVHREYDADWQGDEDGWVGSHPILSSRTRQGLIDEIDAWHAEQVSA